MCSKYRLTAYMDLYIHLFNEKKLTDVVNKAGLKVIELKNVKEHKITRSFVEGFLLGVYNLLRKKNEKEIFVLIAQRQ